MKTAQALRALGPIDAKSVVRDPLLRWIAFYPLLPALMIRWGAPWLAVRLQEQYGFDLVPYYPLLVSFVLLLTPMLAGMVIGFLLLDQRDDRTLSALQVTPLSLNGYLLYRVSLPVALSFLVTLAVVPLAGIVAVGTGTLLLSALASAPLAPFYALTLGAFAENKVQGFALTKAMGILLIPPVMAYFVPPPWQYAFGLDPVYWPAKLFWMLQAGETGYPAVLFAGLAWQGILLVVLLRVFNRVMSR